LGQVRTWVGGMDHVAFRPGQAFLQHADVEIACRRGAAGGQFGAARLVIAIDHHKARAAPFLAVRSALHLPHSCEFSGISLSSSGSAGKSARTDSMRSARRRLGKRPYQRTATDKVTPPPTSTAMTGPSKAAPVPATKAPRSLEAPMKTDSTATTRPRSASGVASGTMEPRTYMLTLSAAPRTARAAKESQKLRERPKEMAASPKMPTAKNRRRPTWRVSGHWVRTSAIPTAPRPGPLRRMPKPSG